MHNNVMFDVKYETQLSEYSICIYLQMYSHQHTISFINVRLGVWGGQKWEHRKRRYQAELLCACLRFLPYAVRLDAHAQASGPNSQASSRVEASSISMQLYVRVYSQSRDVHRLAGEYVRVLHMGVGEGVCVCV